MQGAGGAKIRVCRTAWRAAWYWVLSPFSWWAV